MTIQRKKLNNPAYIKSPINTDDRGNVIYRIFDVYVSETGKTLEGWRKAEYNDHDNVILFEDYAGAKVKVEYDDEDNVTYYEDNLGNYWNNEEMKIPFPFMMHIPEGL